MTAENGYEQDDVIGTKTTYKFYKVLDLHPPCTDEELTKAYKKMAVKYHPDKATGCSEQFQMIKEAYDVLKDPLLRKYYDKYGDSGLTAIFRDGSLSTAVIDSSTWYGRFGLKTMTNPTRLIPYFLFIAFIGVLFVLFLNFIDRKLYYSGLKEIPWPIIFSLLWIVELFFLTILGVFIFLLASNFNFFSKLNEEPADLENISESRKRFFHRIAFIKMLFNSVSSFLFILLSIYCSILLALNLNSSGYLINGFTWMQIFSAEIVFLSIYSVLNIIFKLLFLFRRESPVRSWKERCLFFFNDIYKSIYLPFFIYNFGKWLDSTDRNLISLSLIFGWLYARIILAVINNIVEIRWKFNQMEESLKSNENPSKHAEIEEKIKKNNYRTDTILFICAFLFCFVIGLVHSHFSNDWPHTWSFTLFPLQICIFSSILVFSCCFPCFVTCMEFVTPPNLFDKFNSGEDHVTIIEIPSIYPFGFGLAPLQPRIKVNC